MGESSSESITHLTLNLCFASNILLLLQASLFGIDFDLVRVSVGLEDIPDIRSRFQQALDAVASVKRS